MATITITVADADLARVAAGQGFSLRALDGEDEATFIQRVLVEQLTEQATAVEVLVLRDAIVTVDPVVDVS